MGFTAEQQSAVSARGAELLVSAAAGSGKTAVLVERIIELITGRSDGPANQEPVDIDRLLVVTFTEAAAGEMRARISERLHGLKLQAPGDENLERQLMLLPRAQISTIHSFCADLIRRNFHLTELDPGFKIADETEARLLKSQILDEIFEERYDGDEAFYELVDYYGGGKTKDSGLHELVLKIAEFTSGFPWRGRWLESAAEMYNLRGGFDKTGWAEAVRTELAHRLDGAAAAVSHCMKLAAAGADKYLGALASDMGVIDALRPRLGDLEAFRGELDRAAFAKLAALTAKDIFDPEIKERIQEIRAKEIKPAVGDLRKLLIKPIAEMERDIADLRHVVAALTGLVSEFAARYGEAKRRRNIADFNDLEQYALKILLLPEADENNLMFSEAAYSARERYAEVMTDEYQDSNLVQELILSAVSSGNRFMVGDVKQSIYKFRGARPELFMRKYAAAAELPEASGVGGRPLAKIDLSKNFRSRKCVIDAVNLVFGRLMTPDSEIDYDGNAALYYGADYPGAGELPDLGGTEVYVTAPGDAEEDESGGEPSKAELEAAVMARRIREMVAEKPAYVYDRGEKCYRRARYSDIVILLRSVSGVGEAFLGALKNRGIPAFAESSSGYFEAVEVMTMLGFLQITDNPRQDIPLLATLRSPVYGLTDDELLDIRLGKEGRPFYDCVREYGNGGEACAGTARKLEKFLSDLEGFRREAVYRPISSLIDYVLAVTGYYNYAGAMAGGEVRQANLRLLREKAAQYEETSYRGLFHFIAYMRKVKERGDEGGANALPENADVVRLMTIHKSKGLEFPIVFVGMLGKGFSRQDERGGVLLHGGLGIGAAHIDLERRVRSSTLPRIAVASRLRRESMAEELRVLYVAFTRAREKLILTGSAGRGGLARAREKWERHAAELGGGAKMPAHMIFGASCGLDWLMPVLYADIGENGGESGAGISVYYPDVPDAGGGLSDKTQREERRLAALEELMPGGGAEDETGGTDGDTARRLEWSYPLKPLAGLPAKLSISEIKRLHNRGQDSDAAAYIPPPPTYSPPRFLQGETGPTPAGHGTVMHTVLEHMDMSRENSGEDIRGLVARLAERRILTPYEAGLVDFPALERFCRSDICRRVISASPRVWRETPFVMGLEPYRIYRRPGLKELCEAGGFDGKILVHGIIDCYFEENGRLVLVDYKTGRASGPGAAAESYGVQMAVYKLALERATGKEVSECLLYLFDGGQTVKAVLAEV